LLEKVGRRALPDRQSDSGRTFTGFEDCGRSVNNFLTSSALNDAQVLGTYADKLRSAGKPTKVAITALMRKLIELANTLVKADRLWVLKGA